MKLIDHINSDKETLKHFSILIDGKREIIKQVHNFCISDNSCCIEIANGRLPRVSANSAVWLVAGRDLNA